MTENPVGVTLATTGILVCVGRDALTRYCKLGSLNVYLAAHDVVLLLGRVSNYAVLLIFPAYVAMRSSNAHRSRMSGHACS